MSKIPIFLMFENKSEWTKICLKYLRKNTEESSYRLILINNGSSSFQKDAVKESMRSDEVFLDFKSPVSVSFAYNFAIKECLGDSKYFVILHNDVLVTEGWLDSMVSKAEDSDLFSAVFARTNYCTESTAVKYDEDKRDDFLKFKSPNKQYVSIESIEKVIEETYKIDGGLSDYAKKIREEFGGARVISEELCCFCTLFNSDVFKICGDFDDDFISSGGEMKMFNYKCSEEEIYPILALDVFVHHNGNTTTDAVSRSFCENRSKIDSLVEERINDIRLKKQNRIKMNTKMKRENFSILIIRDDGIGDIIMSLFAVACIKNNIDNVTITYATKPEFMEFVSRFSCIDRVIPCPTYEFDKFSSKMKEEIDSLSEIYVGKFDIIVNLIKYFELTNKGDKMHRIDQIVSYFENHESGIFDFIYPDLPKYNLSNVQDIDIVENGLETIAINMDASCIQRSINVDVFRKILEIESKSKQVIILGKDKVELDWKNINRDNIVDLTGETKLEDIPEILRKCSYVYTPDSGIFHIAGILGVPCRAFFGSIDPEKRDGHYSSSSRNVIYYKKHLPCVPCIDAGCDKIECMRYTDEEIDLITTGKPING